MLLDNPFHKASCQLMRPARCSLGADVSRRTRERAAHKRTLGIH